MVKESYIWPVHHWKTPLNSISEVDHKPASISSQPLDPRPSIVLEIAINRKIPQLRIHGVSSRQGSRDGIFFLDISILLIEIFAMACNSLSNRLNCKHQSDRTITVVARRQPFAPAVISRKSQRGQRCFIYCLNGSWGRTL